jgi:hypothetical protein
MSIEIAMRVSGFLFWFILASWAVMGALGNRIGMGDYNSEAELNKISESPRKFQISIVIALIAHGAIILLAIMLFIAFGPYSIILGIIWTAFRTGEGWIQIYSEKDYWGLLDKAREYSVTSGAEKNSSSDLALTILQTKDSIFKFTQFLWAVGTLALSIVLVTTEVVPHFIGWLGIGTGILGISYNGLFLLKHDYIVLLFIGVLFFAFPFEVIFGGWLLFFS